MESWSMSHVLLLSVKVSISGRAGCFLFCVFFVFVFVLWTSEPQTEALTPNRGHTQKPFVCSGRCDQWL